MMVSGAQSVVMHGERLMLKLFADSSDIQQEVSKVFMKN